MVRHKPLAVIADVAIGVVGVGALDVGLQKQVAKKLDAQARAGPGHPAFVVKRPFGVAGENGGNGVRNHGAAAHFADGAQGYVPAHEQVLALHEVHHQVVVAVGVLEVVPTDLDAQVVLVAKHIAYRGVVLRHGKVAGLPEVAHTHVVVRLRMVEREVVVVRGIVAKPDIRLSIPVAVVAPT
nr:hypothetical protein [Tanacetum cinerariifolium]